MLLLDVSPVVYRAYHATPATALDTFRALVRKIYGLFRPVRGAAVACLDSPGPTFRHDMFWPYKAGRPSKPPELRQLLGMVGDELAGMGWRCVAAPGYEADDIIATLARRFGHVVIVSSDKDLYQLIGTGPDRPASGPVTVGSYAQQWDLALEDLVGRDEVWRKFGVDLGAGEPPGWITELQALMGDRVDNIPGCPGVGKVAADRLVRSFGSAEAAVTAAEQLPLTREQAGKQHRSITAKLRGRRRRRSAVATARRTRHRARDLNMGRVRKPDVKPRALAMLRERNRRLRSVGRYYKKKRHRRKLQGATRICDSLDRPLWVRWDRYLF